MRSLPAPADSGEQLRAAALRAAAKSAWHLCQSLLAMRDGATDELIREVADALKEALREDLHGLVEAAERWNSDLTQVIGRDERGKKLLHVAVCARGEYAAPLERFVKRLEKRVDKRARR